MGLGKIDSKIPKTNKAVDNVLSDCAKRKRIQRFTKEDAKTFLAKAQYHLQSAESFESDGFLDWAVVAYYSAMYMAVKALTSHFSGKAAKDHGCTIALMLKILYGKKFAKTLGGARRKFEGEIELLGKVRQFRNSALYNVTGVKQTEIRKIAKTALEFVEGISKLLE